MLPEIEQLLVLQNRDQKIRALEAELKVSPSERRDLEARLAAGQAKFDALKKAVQDLELERKKLELEANSKRGSIEKFKTQQTLTRKNEEFQALAGEIDRYERDISAIEDRELEVMERIEAARGEAAKAGAKLESTKTAVATQLKDIEVKVQTLKEQATELQQDRAGKAQGLDEDLLSLYERLLKSKGDAALVALEHDVCTGCHMKVTTQTSLRARGSREVVCCENCGRILYDAG